jgi:cell wall-associated NlpC family hydrolase
MKQKVIGLALAMSLLVPSAIANGATTWTSATAATKYNTYIGADSYVKDELYNVADFRIKYENVSGTLAYQIVDRAIWYMQNGYMVYGHGTNSYANYGYLDCSNFTKLVYGDFGYSITGASASYDTVGSKVAGVSKAIVNGKWMLTGIENLRIGDILTWQETDHIMHVAIYMGTNRDGQPVVIGTRGDGNPTAIGTVDGWQYWWGENFREARRILPESAYSTMAGKTTKAPMIPKSYVLAPQSAVPSVPAPPTTPVIPPTTPVVKRTYVVTVKGWVGLHASAKLSSATVGRLELGQKAELVKKVNSYWYEVKVNGKTLYITTSATYTKIITA